MSKLTKQIGSDKNYIELSVDTNADCDFGYDEVKASMFKNGRSFGDFTQTLYDSGVLHTLVDQVDWIELYRSSQLKEVA